MSEPKTQTDMLLALLHRINDGLHGINRGIAEMRAGIHEWEPLPADEVAQMEREELEGSVATSHNPSAFLQGFNAEHYFTDAELERFLAADSLDELAERGFLDEPATEAPDVWVPLTDSQLADEYGLSDAEQIFCLDEVAEGGEAL